MTPVKPANQELEEKGNAEQHRGLQLNLSSPHGCEPVEILMPVGTAMAMVESTKKDIRVWAHADGDI